MHKRGPCCCPCTIRPSVTFVHSVQTALDIVKLLCRLSSLIILVFDPNAGIQFQGEPLQRGRKI